jgi:hypothetical protein
VGALVCKVPTAETNSNSAGNKSVTTPPLHGSVSDEHEYKIVNCMVSPGAQVVGVADLEIVN